MNVDEDPTTDDGAGTPEIPEIPVPIPMPIHESLPSASIIIRTKNEERGIGSTLRGVFHQTVPPHEVIVIDSGSTDKTLTIARGFPITLLTLDPSQWGYSRALNRAASHATGEVLVALSGHCPPVDRDWLRNMLRHFTDPAVAAVWGPGLRPRRPAPIPGPPKRQEPGAYGVDNRMWGYNNANGAVRRSLWEQFPFDESLPAAEDKAWGREAMARGYCIVHDPRAAVWHERHTFASAYRRNQAVAAGFSMMFPELDGSPGVAGRTVARAGMRAAAFHLRHREFSAFLYDLSRIPATLAAIVGGLRGRRRSR